MSNEVLELKAGEYVMRDGEESTQMYYLQSGSLAVYKLKGGAEQQIGTIYSGELVGEMSFLDKQPRSASVKAIGECKLLVIPHDKFEKYFQDQPAWYKALINTLLERLRKANTRIRI
ncbi:Crp/Fnr family transcriptional regulator [Halobacteriovorax sp. HLS]|uniref:Crp/Fnr family transcriptional regulator n=1 Tax=Halobacteriovorax sp. HLS TaxID=2234000 RepID=UPI000FDB0DB5|nr:cyclic nucleotide-binding domain-containing protein [Halobacteriovorax sp. HLS]